MPTRPTLWPAAFDPAAAGRLLADFPDESEPVRAILRCLGGNSPFLASLAERDIETIRAIATTGPDPVAAQALERVRALSPTASRAETMATLRRAKRVVALTAAVADIGGIWPLETVTTTLSDLAAGALRASLRHLLRAAHDIRDIRLSDPNRPDNSCGFVALAMGKLGAGELNYSSDIDLILIYDSESPVFARGRAADRMGQLTTRFARDLVTLMEFRDADGYVFRTDLRLRPDPAATPPAISFNAALTYYETMGQNWERAAMIKALPIAGDMALGTRFLEAIRPFVWRRGLDFAAVADIHAMKRRIDEVKKTGLHQADDPVQRIAGYNVKLGEGGIREIEFLVQTLQMVWGGRDPTLRIKPTLEAMRKLVETGHLRRPTCERLTEAYRYLRTVEHRIQMVNDRQTHSLPDKPAEVAHIAAFMGYRDAPAFAADLLRHAKIVRTAYRAVFEFVPDPPKGAAAHPNLDFRGDDPEPAETISALTAMGFRDGRRVVAAVRRWLAGRIRALRSPRARDLMTEMLPTVLAAFANEPDPDEAFARFDRLISALPTGVQLMSLFQRNPALLERVATVLGAAPMLSEHLALYPSALEGLLTLEPTDDPRAMLKSRLADARTLEDAIRITGRAVKELDFLLSVAMLEGRLGADASGLQRTALADAAIAALVPRVLADFSTRFGKVPGGSLAVVAMGKAGGREMMAGSDLDLIFVYDHPQDATESVGGRSLATSQWFVRAVSACIAALTAPGVEGQMYALDMRLRPSGNKGPLAVPLEGFRRYHAAEAWTWERMALTRARVVAGPAKLRAAVKDAIAAGLDRPVDAATVLRDAAAMRAKMDRELRPHGPWDVKLRPGGLVDIEFIAQVLQLVYPQVKRSQTTRLALRNLRQAGVLAHDDANTLASAECLWRTIQGILRMTVGRVEDVVLPAASARLVLEAVRAAGVEAADVETLLRHVDRTASQVRQLLHRYLAAGNTDG